MSCSKEANRKKRKQSEQEQQEEQASDALVAEGAEPSPSEANVVPEKPQVSLRRDRGRS